MGGTAADEFRASGADRKQMQEDVCKRLSEGRRKRPIYDFLGLHCFGREASGTKAASGGMERSGNAPVIAASAAVWQKCSQIGCRRGALEVFLAGVCGT